ncbi:amidohydrolase, partial [Morganella morganii]
MSLSRAFATTLLAAACSAYAADPADLMITDGTVLTMNPENTVFEHGTVVVSDGKIVAVGGPELTAKYQAKKVLDVKGDI